MQVTAISVIEREKDGAVLCVRSHNQWRLPGASADGVPPDQVQAESLFAQTGLDTHSRDLLLNDGPLFAYKVVGFGSPRGPVGWLKRDAFLDQSPHKGAYAQVFGKLPKQKLHAVAVVEAGKALELHYVHALDSQNAKVKFQIGRRGKRDTIVAVGPVIGYFVNDREGKILSV